MTKKLFIVRHADAQAGSTSDRDFDRLLSDVGNTDAEKMASWFKQHYEKPEYWLSSSAPRCHATAKHFIALFSYASLNISDALYEAPYRNLLNSIKQIPPHNNSAILFGHNPSVSYLVNYLTGQPVSYQTAMVCELTTEKGWDNLEEMSCELINHQAPNYLDG